MASRKNFLGNDVIESLAAGLTAQGVVGERGAGLLSPVCGKLFENSPYLWNNAS
jgi:hypothetical protein